ncbi:MAG TPA: hypothetical protein VN175_02695 [Rhizomicrobium sp.]|nr:hypothetical protein [Rhizomicrobium sp.]
MPNEKDEQVLAELMIDMHGAQAIKKAQEFLYGQAMIGNAPAASKWLRVMTLIEFSESGAEKKAAPPPMPSNA